MKNDKTTFCFMTDPDGMLHNPVIRMLMLAYLKITKKI